jgi:hypothetical protein
VRLFTLWRRQIRRLELLRHFSHPLRDSCSALHVLWITKCTARSPAERAPYFLVLDLSEKRQRQIFLSFFVKICEFTPFYTSRLSCILPPLSTTNKLVSTQPATSAYRSSVYLRTRRPLAAGRPFRITARPPRLQEHYIFSLFFRALFAPTKVYSPQPLFRLNIFWESFKFN